ncbi:MAG: hypothetical protein M3Y35_03285, partial [Actinomycetota bacterium]|nr:hypothetical protein [Actinomycetota bacterium]
AAVVGLAFAVAASTFCPLLVLGVWWRRLTDVGAIAGLLVGGGLATAAVLITMLGPTETGWIAVLLAQPAAWTVPLTFAIMILGSLLTPGRVPLDVGQVMVRLHAPESLIAQLRSQDRSSLQNDRSSRSTDRPPSGS